MWTAIYTVGVIWVVAYLLILAVINVSKNFSAKKVGWLSLSKVTLRTKNAVITVGKIKLNVNPFTTIQGKRVSLDLSEVYVRLLEKEVVVDSPAPKKKSKKAVFEDDLIKLHLSQRLYGILSKYRILNFFKVQLYNVTISHPKIAPKVLFFNYMNYIVKKDTDLSAMTFHISLFRGFLLDEADTNEAYEKFRIFNNIELEVKCLSYGSSNPLDRSKVTIILKDFVISLTLGKVRLPLNEFHFQSKPDPKPKPVMTLQDKIQKRNFMEKKINAILSLITSIELKLESFQLEIGSSVVTCANFLTNVQTVSQLSLHNIEVKEPGKEFSLHILAVYLTSLKIQHQKYQILDLPNANLTINSDFHKIVNSVISESYLNELKEGKTATQVFGIKGGAVVNNPSLDIYYDQIVVLAKKCKSEKKDITVDSSLKDDGSSVKNAMLVLLDELNNLSFKFALFESRINLHIPLSFQNHGYERDNPDNQLISLSLLSVTNESLMINPANHPVERGFKKKTAKHIRNALKFKRFRWLSNENLLGVDKLNFIIDYNLKRSHINVNTYLKSVELVVVHESFIQRLAQLMNLFIEAEPSDDVEGQQQPETLATSVQKVNAHFTELVPSMVHSFKLVTTQILVSISCKESFPSNEFINPLDSSVIDLGDFSRGLRAKVTDININFNRRKDLFNSGISAITIWTITELLSDRIVLDAAFYSKHNNVDSLDDDYYDLESADDSFSEMSTINTEINNSWTDDDSDLVQRVLFVRELRATNQGESKRIAITIPEIEGNISVFLFWLGFYLTGLIHNSGLIKKSKRKVIQSSTKKYLDLDLHINSIDIKAMLPNDVDLLLEIDTLNVTDIMLHPSVKFSFFRGYVMHPKISIWTRLIIIRESEFKLNDEKTGSKFQLVTDGIRLNTPYDFLFFTVIDNIATFYKTFKQLKHNFERLHNGEKDFPRLPPQQEDAKMIPKINIKARSLLVTLEDDPFESQLSLVFQLGFLEQAERLRKWKLFKETAETKLRGHANVNTLTDSIQTNLTNAPVDNSRFLKKDRAFTTFSCSKRQNQREFGKLNFKKVFHAHNSNNNSGTVSSEESQPDKPKTTTDFEDVAIAKDKLLEHFSDSWISKFKAYKKTREDAMQYKTDTSWGKESINPTFLAKHSILAYPKTTPLFVVLFKDLDLTFDKPSFEFDKVDHFLYTYGKKQPKQVYTTLIPMNLNILSSTLVLYLRDYPLPLLSFPENRNGQPAVHIHGDIVVNEQLNAAPDAIRFVYVPFVPAAEANDLGVVGDGFYNVSIPRTLTPVKFMANLNFDINTSEACTLSWCKSFSPALSATMASFDCFTKPPYDLSPKIGIWDKVGLLLHGKFTFAFENELRFLIKGSPSPYNVTGVGAGLAFSWQNKVRLRINDTGKQDELFLLDSQDFVLAIPSHSSIQRDFWNMKRTLANLEGNILDQDKPFKKVLMKLSSPDKLVRWKLGLLFERNIRETKEEVPSHNSRTHKFRPHYDVMLKNPNFLPPGEVHDSYKNFRSDYLHLAISVTSDGVPNSSDSYNTVHLSPEAFHYFLHWWDMFSLTTPPIKQGKLFDNPVLDNRPSVGFGKHLYTVKYQLVLEPVFISHMYMHSTNDGMRKNSKIAFTGVKGKLDRFAMDLHQRRQLMTFTNKALDKSYKILKLKMYQGDVDLEAADIRLVNAIFNARSLSGSLVSRLYASDSTTPESESISGGGSKFSQYMDRFDVSDGDYSWLDEDDYVEVEADELNAGYPNIKIIPLMFTPRFSYIRQFQTDDGPCPFGNEPSHECLIGKTHPEKTQERLALTRSKYLNDKVKENEALIESINKESNLKSADVRAKLARLEAENKDMKHRLHIVHCVIDDLYLDREARYDSSSDDGELSEAETSASGLLPVTPTVSHSVSAAGRRLSGLSLYSSGTGKSSSREIAEHDPNAKFHNRFLIHNAQVKWNNELRDIFLEYIGKVGERKASVYFMGRRAVKFVEDLVGEKIGDKSFKDFDETDLSYSFSSNAELVDNFDGVMRSLATEDHQIEDAYLVKFITPQIQLVSAKDEDTCVLITSRDIELKIMDVYDTDVAVISETDKLASIIETRYGILFKDAHFFVFNKATCNYAPSFVYGNNFGCQNSTPNWPPWLEIEMCYDSAPLKEKIIIEKTSIGYLYTKPNKLFANEKREGDSSMLRLRQAKVLFPKFVIRCSSDQYALVYGLGMDLLLSNDKSDKKSLDRFEKIISVSDWEDFKGMDIRVQEIQETVRFLTEIKLHLKLRDVHLTDNEKDELNSLEIELERKKIELYILMKGLQKRGNIKNADKMDSIFWIISADQIIWHMLDEDRKPFIDLAIANSYFTRMESPDGSNINKVVVSIVQGFDLQEKSIYPEMLSPLAGVLNQKEACALKIPMIVTNWSMLEPVGGISIMKEASVKIQPLRVQLEYHTSKKVFDYIFPKTEENEIATPVNGSPESSRSSLSLDSVGVMDSPIAATSSRSSLSSFLKGSKKSSGESSPTSRKSTDSIQSDSRFNKKKNQLIPSKLNGKDKKKLEEDDNITQMVTRSSKYFSILSAEVEGTKLCISFKAPKHLNIIDVHNLEFNLPTLSYKDKFWSGEEFALRLKKDIVKIVLHHSGDILTNKLRHHRKRRIITTPLKQISNYVSFTTAQDLASSKDGDEIEEKKNLVPLRGHIHVNPNHRHHHHHNGNGESLGSNLPRIDVSHSRHDDDGDIVMEMIDESNETE